MKFKQNAGVTLMEILISIAVIAGMAAVAIPNYQHQLPDIRLNAAVRGIKSDLGLAKYKAIRENGPVVVTFDTAINQYTIFVDNGDGAVVGGIAGNGHRDGTETAIKTIVMPDGVTLYKAAFAGGRPRVRFDGRGLPNGLGGSVSLKNTLNTYRKLSVSLVGRITIRISSDNGATWQSVD